MGILGTLLGIQNIPHAHITGTVPVILKDLEFEYRGLVERAARAVADLF